MKICFVFRKFTLAPVGGYKIAFEYANRLAERNHEVSLLFINDIAIASYKFPRLVKGILCDFFTSIEPQWFPLRKEIKKYSAFNHNLPKKLLGVDIAVATAVETVDYVGKTFQKAKKMYLIQGYEIWNKTEQEVHETYALGYSNIVVASWLQNIVNQYSKKPCTLIKNPIDINVYCCHVEQQNRVPHSVAFLYHRNECKGVKYAIEAVERIKKIYPDLKAYSFGTVKNPEDLPKYVEYIYCASQKQTVEIYNKSTIFLCTTISEGYGLTGLEAMACGAVLISTGYLGVYEYAVDGVNALLSPIKDVSALVSNVCKVFEDRDLRLRLSKYGIQSVQKLFTWEMAVDKFEKIMLDE